MPLNQGFYVKNFNVERRNAKPQNVKGKAKKEVKKGRCSSFYDTLLCQIGSGFSLNPIQFYEWLRGQFDQDIVAGAD